MIQSKEETVKSSNFLIISLKSMAHFKNVKPENENEGILKAKW